MHSVDGQRMRSSAPQVPRHDRTSDAEKKSTGKELTDGRKRQLLTVHYAIWSPTRDCDCRAAAAACSTHTVRRDSDTTMMNLTRTLPWSSNRPRRRAPQRACRRAVSRRSAPPVSSRVVSRAWSRSRSAYRSAVARRAASSALSVSGWRRGLSGYC